MASWRAAIWYARGINKEHFLIFRMATLRHNSIKPHGGIGGRTPAEAAGTGIWGADRWLVPVQNAAAAT